MASKHDLIDWVHEIVKAKGGKANIVEIAMSIWTKYESELRSSGTLFYTWQYDMRWAAQELRDKGIFKKANLCTRGSWELV